MFQPNWVKSPPALRLGAPAQRIIERELLDAMVRPSDQAFLRDRELYKVIIAANLDVSHLQSLLQPNAKG